MDETESKKSDNQASLSIQAAMVICVRGSGNQAWVPVPTVARGGASSELCVTLSSRSTWAHRVLGRKSRDEHDAAAMLKAFEQDMRSQLQRDAKPDGSENGDTPDDAGKESLFSDGEEEHCEDEIAKPPKGSKRKRESVKTVGFTTLMLGDREIKVGVHKGPGLQLPADQLSSKMCCHT